jgi:hypothetical protein
VNVAGFLVYFLDHNAFYFVNATYKSQIWDGVLGMKDHMDQAGLRNNEANYVPSIGDYVYFHAELPEISAHVGIVIGKDTAGTTITTIEGNTDGDGVTRAHLVLRRKPFVLGQYID